MRGSRLEDNNEITNVNDYLFRALVCAPIALLFSWLAVSSISASGFGFINTIFLILALCSSLFALGYAAFHTNECYAADEEPHH